MIKRRRVVRVRASLPVLIISLCHDGVLIFSPLICHHVQYSGLVGFCLSLESLSPHAECVGGRGGRFQLWRPPRGSARVQGWGSREPGRMLCSEGGWKRRTACLVRGKISLKEYAKTQLWNEAFTAKLYTWFCLKLFSYYMKCCWYIDFFLNTRTSECKHSIELFYIVFTNLDFPQWFYFQLLFSDVENWYSFWRCKNRCNIYNNCTHM